MCNMRLHCFTKITDLLSPITIIILNKYDSLGDIWVKALILLDQSDMVEKWDLQNAGTTMTKLQKIGTPRNFETEA